MDLQRAGTFEHSLAELEVIVHELEEGQLGLAEALARYEQGVKHLKHCYALLADAEQKIELLTGVNAAGDAVTEPFVESDDASAASAKAPSRRRAKTKPPQPPAEDLTGLGRDIDDGGDSI